MISKEMKQYVDNGSAIREMFEEGARLAGIYGKDKVYDFSLGNPNIPVPEAVTNAIKEIIEQEDSVAVHGYMNNSGYEYVRAEVAHHLNELHQTHFTEKNIIMTVGAAGGINVIFKTLLDPEDEVVVFAPYFGEYRSYTANYHGKLVEVPANPPTFLPKKEEVEAAITPKTKIVLVNTPNNPTGVVYSKEVIEEITDVLKKKEEEYDISIYLIADEPYRELVYDGVKVPYLTPFYHNTIVGYSYSKSLSLPGERIGYLVIPEEVDDFEDIVIGVNVANRILGFVNAPSLLQKVVAKCLGEEANVGYYDTNRKTLFEGLTSFGYECIRPYGAFYLFVKSPIEDDREFCKLAKKYNILVVPGTSFAAPGYFRISYSVAYETIVNSLPGFKELAKEVGILQG